MHSPFTGGLKNVVFFLFIKYKMCANEDMLYASSLVGSSSSGSEDVERGRATNRLQHWHCGGVMHDMLMKLKKGSWCVPLSKA